MTAAADFHRAHPICDLLGLNLTHPRFLLDHYLRLLRQVLPA